MFFWFKLLLRKQLEAVQLNFLMLRLRKENKCTVSKFHQRFLKFRLRLSSRCDDCTDFRVISAFSPRLTLLTVKLALFLTSSVGQSGVEKERGFLGRRGAKFRDRRRVWRWGGAKSRISGAISGGYSSCGVEENCRRLTSVLGYWKMTKKMSHIMKRFWSDSEII